MMCRETDREHGGSAMIDSFRRAIYHTLKAPRRTSLQRALLREGPGFADLAKLLPRTYMYGPAFERFYSEYCRTRDGTPATAEQFDALVYNALAYGMEPFGAIRLLNDWLKAMGYEAHA